MLEIDEADDQVIMKTFQARLSNPDLIFSLGNTLSTSMTDLLFKAQKYMNKEDALTVKGLIGKRKKEEPGDSQGKKKDRKDSYLETKANKSSFDPSKKKMNFTPLVMSANKILMQIKDELGFKWPKPLSMSSRKHDPNKHCRFHKDHSHYIDECRDLKEQIKELIQLGKLQKFIKRDHHPRARTDDKSHDNENLLQSRRKVQSTTIMIKTPSISQISLSHN